MRGLHQGAARRATAGRVALGAALALALGACTLTPWRTAATGETEDAADTGVTASAVQAHAITASTLPASGGAGAPAAATGATAGFYRVKPGDTLYHVAKANGQRPADLVSWNKLPADGKIQVGQLLRVAPPVAAAAPAASPPGAAATAATPVAQAPPVASAPKSAAAARDDTPQPVAAAKADTPKAAARTNARFIWPIEGSVAQPFKAKSKGVVIAGPAGQEVKAAAAGRVVYAGSGMKAYGKLVIVKHDARLITAYGRNGKLLVKEGEAVKRGQAIAMSGTDGAGISALMFEVRENGKPVDPLPWLPKAQP
jgi:lipoprotein NlpD